MGEYPNKHLQKLATTNPQELKNICSKGGSVVGSLKKKYAAKIREMKKRGANQKDIDWFLERIIDPQSNMIEIEEYLEQSKDHMSEINYISLKDKLHRTRFGDKHTINSTNININISSQEAIEHMEKVFGNND